MARSYRGAGVIRWGAQDGKDGVNYLIMGWWSANIHYKLTDAGIPVVKVEDTSPDKFSVYKLTALQSTLGIFVASEWEKVKSADFIYMQDAYIENLQAELITADKIEALDIRAKRIITPFVELSDSDAIYDPQRDVYKIQFDLNLSSGGYSMPIESDRYVYDWIELPFDSSYIGSRIVILNNCYPPYTRTVGSARKTVVCVGVSSKNIPNGYSIGIGGKPVPADHWTFYEPFAVEFIAQLVEFICVPRIINGVTYPYWFISNWTDGIEDAEWT